MIPVYANEPFPNEVTRTIFLAGPSPRSPEIVSWRKQALELLKEWDGHVFLPEPRNQNWVSDYDQQIDWETEGLNRADIIVFWIPRHLATLPGFTTNVEWGAWLRSGKVVYGRPQEAEKCRYLDYQAAEQKITVHTTLASTLQAATHRLSSGALRTAGETTVPLHIWNHPAFQSWHQSQKSAGNRLLGARVCFTFPTHSSPFLFAVHARMWIESESREKTNEVIIGRHDVAHVVLYHPRPSSPDPLDTEIVLVREFRVPARTRDGFIHENPGGSSKRNHPPLETILSEIEEEIGLKLPPDRLQYIGSRQLAGTLSVHSAHLFTARLTDMEMASVRAQASINQSFGVSEDSERTYTEVRTLRDILASRDLDFSNLGMLAQVFLSPAR